jgi:four helix bundle protein
MRYVTSNAIDFSREICVNLVVISDKKQEIRGYKSLIAWQKADKLAHEVYSATSNFPKAEIFGLTSQIRRAVLSVPANITEGYARNSKNEFRRFLSISLGSLAELEYFLDFAFKENFLQQKNFESLMILKDECGRIIWSLYRSQK